MDVIEGKYRPFKPVDLKERRWPSRTISHAPIWCSVDLRDGNQALINPMNVEQKIRFFKLLRQIGFKEIEIGFPAASNTEYTFTRQLLDDKLLGDDIVPQILTQARDGLIKSSFESLKGFPRAIVHLYNSTSEVQRRLVFRKERQGIIEIARRGADLIQELKEKNRDTDFTLQYSPESFSATELDFSLEICSAVIDLWQPTAEKPMIINLPSTVELSTPNIFADQIEYMDRHLPAREGVILSIHPHNDRGTAIASAELALLAGGQRIEGTLFGNGERTGNVDIVTMALNMLIQGINPQLDLSCIKSIRKTSEYCTSIPVHERHPYAGDLVFTAFSGSHQDAIKKGMQARRQSNAPHWEVPYLPIDPDDIGRHYEPVIRVNSQSGKGGIAYIMESEFHLELPRPLQLAFSHIVQGYTDHTKKEITSSELWDLFEKSYFVQEPLVYQNHNLETESKTHFKIKADLMLFNRPLTILGYGNGPIDAFLQAINHAFDLQVSVKDYHQHATSVGAKANSAAYLEIQHQKEKTYGIALHENIVVASLVALTHGINCMCQDGRIVLRTPQGEASQ